MLLSFYSNGESVKGAGWEQSIDQGLSEWASGQLKRTICTTNSDMRNLHPEQKAGSKAFS
jgi:hypothetical protein